MASEGVRRPDGDAASVFVSNAAVRLHVLDNGHIAASPPPVLVVPGMGEYADEYAWMLDRLGDRRVVVADLRGRGGSDAPHAGYAWEDHIGDLRAVIESLQLDRPILVAFSRGSSYALGYALWFTDNVRGLVVGDYSARHVGLPAEFAATPTPTSPSCFPSWSGSGQPDLRPPHRGAVAGGFKPAGHCPGHVLARSVARDMDRPYVHVRAGGEPDEERLIAPVVGVLGDVDLGRGRR